LSLLNFLKPTRGNPFTSQDYYDRDDQELADLNPKELARLRDTRELGLGPVRIADGVAISRDGYFSAVLQVGTVNFALATAEEQESIIGGYHAVLRQLSGSHYQIKVRVVEADLEPLAQRVDYALRGYTSPTMHRLALQYKQFLREELPNRLALMERRNYVIAGVHSPLLVKMAQVFEQETAQPCPIFNGLGYQWRQQERREGISNVATYPKTSARPNKSQKAKKPGSLNSADLRKEQLFMARIQAEMEGKMYQELERTLRRLKHELNILVTGLGANGLAVHRLNDWELTALYAEYLRPELAEEVRHSLSAQTRTQIRPSRPTGPVTEENWYSSSARPLSLPEFMGEQSGMVVVSDLPADSPAYGAGSLRTGQALEQLKNRPGVAKIETPQTGNQGKAGHGINAGNARPGPALTGGSVPQEKVSGGVRLSAGSPPTLGQPVGVLPSNSAAGSGAGAGAGRGIEKAPKPTAAIINLPSIMPVRPASSIVREPEPLAAPPPLRSRIPGRQRQPTSVLNATVSKEQRLET
jgi:hypothetical protein